MRFPIVLFAVQIALLATHQVDAAFWHEWDVFGVPGGIPFFLAFHFGAMLVLLASFAAVASGHSSAPSRSAPLRRAGSPPRSTRSSSLEIASPSGRYRRWRCSAQSSSLPWLRWPLHKSTAPIHVEHLSRERFVAITCAAKLQKHGTDEPHGDDFFREASRCSTEASHARMSAARLTCNVSRRCARRAGCPRWESARTSRSRHSRRP